MIKQTGEGAYYDYVLGQMVDDFLLTKVTVKEKEPVSIMSTLKKFLTTDPVEPGYSQRES